MNIYDRCQNTSSIYKHSVPDLAEIFLLKCFIPNNKVNQQENSRWDTSGSWIKQVSLSNGTTRKHKKNPTVCKTRTMTVIFYFSLWSGISSKVIKCFYGIEL